MALLSHKVIGGLSMDRYIFFSIPIELEKEMVPVAYDGYTKHVGRISVRELQSANYSAATVM